jgi:hypothetical protein
MIDLNDLKDYVGLMILAAIVGAVGGFVGELMISRRSGSGQLEAPHKSDRGRFWDLGFFAGIIVGAAAAVAVMLLLPPAETVVKDGVETTSYDLIRVVAQSLIVGSAGTSFMRALRDKVSKVVADTKLETVKGQLDELSQAGDLDAPGLQSAVKAVSSPL